EAADQQQRRRVIGGERGEHRAPVHVARIADQQRGDQHQERGEQHPPERAPAWMPAAAHGTPPGGAGGSIAMAGWCAGSKPAHDGKRRRKWNNSGRVSTCHGRHGGIRDSSTTWQSASINRCRRACRSLAKPRSRTNRLASRLSDRLRGSRLLEPTVAHSRSITATLPWNGRRQYSRMSTPLSTRWRYRVRAAVDAIQVSGSPCTTSVTATPRRAAWRRSRRKP